MITILHNPRCGKSREGIAMLKEVGEPFEIVKYLDNPLNDTKLTSLIQKLNCNPLDLVRQNEKIWIEKFKGKNLSDIAVIQAIAQHPILMERPIVISENKAVIGSPPQKILEFLKK